MDFDLTGLKPLDTSGLQPLDVTGLTPLGGGESFIQKAENFVGGLFGDKVSDKSLSGLITGDQTTPGPIGARRPVSSDNDASVFGKEAVKGLGSIGTSAIETPALLAYKKTASDFVTADKILRGDENMSPSNLGEQPPYLIGRDKDGRIQWTDTKTGEIGQLYGAAQKYFDEKDPEKRAEIRRQTLAAADPRNDPLYQKGKAGEAAMESALPTTQEEKGSWSGMFGQAAGSLIGFAAGGEGLAATKIPRALSIAGLGAVVEGSQDFNTAISKGADLDTAVDVGLAGMGIGTTEAIPIDHLLGRLDKLSGGRLRTAVVNAVKSAGEEGTQEALQQLLQNLVAKYGYNDSQQPTEGVGTNAAVGAGSGAAFSFLLTMILGKHAHSGPAPAEGETTNPASPTAGGRSAGGPASVTAPPPAQPASPEALAAAAASLTPEDHASPLPTDLIVTGKAVIADALAGKPRPDQAGAVPAETVGVPSPAAEEGGSGDLGSLLGAPPAQEANPINQLGDTVAPPVGVEYQPGQSGEEIGTSSSDINGLTSNSNAEEITPAPATEAASVVPAAGAAPAGDLDVSGLRPIDDSVGVTDSSASFSSVVPRGTIEDASQAGVENVRAVQGAENVASPVALPGVSEHAGPGALAAQRQPQPEATPQGQNAPAPRQVEIARRVTAYVAERSNSLIPQQVAAKLGITPQEATAALTTLANQRVIRRVGKAGRFMRHPTSGATGVLEFLAARGGVADNEGHDLKAGRNAQRNFPRYGPLIRKSGMSIDAAGEALHEAGYFGDPASTPRPTTAQVLDLIDGELAGKKTTALGDEGEAAARGEGDRARAAAEAEVERVIADRGLNTTDEERSAAVALMVSEGYDPLDALDHVLERAALQDDFVQLAADNERDRRHGFDALPPETQSDAAPGADEAASPPRGAPDELGAERPVGTPAPSGQSGQDHHGTVEQTDQGQQSVIPGAERISDRQHAERTIEAPLRAKAPQKAPDEGLFDTGSHRQTDLLDQGKLLRESERTPTTLSGKAPFGGTRPHDTGGPASDAQGQSNAAENSGAARTRPSPAEETPSAGPRPETGDRATSAQGQSSTENVSPGTEENKPTRERLGLSKKEPKLNKARQTGRAPAERTAAPNEREHLDQAALKVNGEVYTGPTHGDAYEAAINAGVLESEIDKVDQNGFVTSTGRYVGREEALKIASQSGKRYRRIGNAVTSQGTTAPTYEDLTGQRDRRTGLLPERPANPHFLENLEEIAADLSKRLSKLGIADKVALRLKDRINEAETADGRYARGLIEVALTAPDEQWVLNHESIHALRDLGVFRDAEWRALEKAARSGTARMKEIRQRYAGLDEDSLAEEAIADAYADWVKGKGETQGFLRMGFERIRNFFRALMQALKGGGFTTAEGVFGKIERGEVGRRDVSHQPRDAQGQFTPMTQEHRYALSRRMTGSPDEPNNEAAQSLLDLNDDLFGKLSAENDSAIRRALDSARTAIQDRFLPLLRVQQKIEADTGRPIADELNAYLIEEGFSGRTAERLQQFELKFKRPLVEAIHKSGLSLERIHEYLYARHAKERNRAIAKINPELPDGGSGMTDAESSRILDEAKADGSKAALDEIAKLHDAIHKESIRSRVADGLLSRDTADKWAAIYKNYTPLRGKGDLADNVSAARPSTGRGYTVRGQESKRAMGRRSKANDLLPYTLMQAEEAIIRGEKNRVGQALINLAKSAPDESYWKVDKIDTKRRINDEGQVEDYSSVDRNDPNTLLVKIDGEQHRLWISDARLATSLKNLDADKVGFVIRALMKVNRVLSALSTGFNPEFVISNSLRDLQAGTLNLAAQGRNKIALQVLRDYRKALAAGWGGVKGREATEWQKWFREYAASGGKVDFWKPTDVRQHRANLERDLRLEGVGLLKGSVAGQTEKGIRSALNFVNDVNQQVDNSIRLATYVNLRRAGVSRLKAASAARNLTVNFNRRGELGPQLNALYLFFNASVQGTAVIAKIASTRKGRRVLTAIVLAGIASELLNGALSPPDKDDGESKYDKIPSFEKSRNLIVMLPEGWGPDYLKVPMPYGFNAFFDLGRNLAAYARGVQKLGESIGNIAKTFADGFNPVGGTNSILSFLSPTILDPFADLATNEDFAGRPIMPEQDPFGPPKPDSQRYWGSVNEISKEVAQKLNEITGGNEFKPGAIDISPESIDHWASFVGGGLGSLIYRGATAVANLAHGKPITVNDIPFVRKVTGQKGLDSDVSLFYDRAQEIEALAQEHKGLTREGRIADAKAVRLANTGLYSLISVADHTRDVLSRLRKAKERAQANITDPLALKTRLDEIDQKRRKAVAHFNALYNEKVTEPGKKDGLFGG